MQYASLAKGIDAPGHTTFNMCNDRSIFVERKVITDRVAIFVTVMDAEPIKFND